MAADIRTGGLFDKGKPVAFIIIPLFLECIITCVCMSLSVFIYLMPNMLVTHELIVVLTSTFKVRLGRNY